MLTLFSLVLLLLCFLSTREATYALSFIPISLPTLKRCPEKIKYVIYRARSVRMGKNCALGQDLGHSFFPYGPPARQITYIYLTLDDDFWRIQRPMDNSIVAEWANLFLNKVHFSLLISPHESNEKSYRERTLPREKIFDIAFLL